MKNLKVFANCSIFKFLIVGIINTILGFAFMSILYDSFHLGYWLSTALTYLVGNILSFILNRSFTFHYAKNNYKVKIKFTINVVLCYLVAYGFSCFAIKPYLINCFSEKSVVKFLMFISIGFYTILNYTGQRFWVFK